MIKIYCLGRDNVSRIYFVEHILEGGSLETHSFNVHRSNPPNLSKDDFFEFRVCRFSNNEFMIISIDHHYKEWFRAKGISEAIILYAAKYLDAKIVSSSNKKKKFNIEFRSDEADKVWVRLVNEGHAIYNKLEDRYYTNT